MGKIHKPISIESPAVQSHLGTLQGVIGRLSNLSAAVKTWAATVIGLVAILSSTGSFRLIALSLIMATLCFMDSYYLAKEKHFRDVYKKFVSDLHEGKLERQQLFVIAPSSITFLGWLRGLSSPATWPFYLSLAVVIAFVGCLGGQ